MLVSIIIPTYNRVKLLRNAIDSVLKQTYQKFEIIIVDDASTDETQKFILSINDKRIRYFKNKINLYAAESRNIGISQSKGDLIAFLDDDDEWFPYKLEKQVHLFSNKKIGLVYSSINLFFEKYNFSYNTTPRLSGYIYKEMLIKNCIGATPSVVVRRKAIFDLNNNKNKFFDSDFPAREEYDLWIRLCKKWDVEYVKFPLLKQFQRNSINRISGNVNNYIKAIELLNIKYESEVMQILSKEEKKKRFFQQKFFLGSQAIKINNTKLARKYFFDAFKINKNFKVLVIYLASFFGSKFIIKLRSYLK
tara:strand:- start:897 stop:1814 length:918 start_codon:yes stop_codon:yes gene_type:complete